MVVSVWPLSFLSISTPTTSSLLRSRRRQIERADREREIQLQQMRDRLYQERFEKDELKRSMVSVMEESRRVMSSLSELEARIKDLEPRFATPEGSQSEGG